ncbi:hydrogenase nickel incorporation protein HypB [Nocardioides hungaricus]
MCATCGCADGAGVRVSGVLGAEHDHHHDHDHTHEHPAPTLERLEIDVLAKNDALAAANRRRAAEQGRTVLNLMSSPGSGKTTLLVRTLRELAGELPLAVVEGDQETRLDAERIHATGVPVVQVNTGAGCHLDAAMLADALGRLDPGPGALVFVENVGNLVCPALFDLGEDARIVVISVTEGADKPTKYPAMFAAADLLVINKVDLLPYVDFDVDDCVRRAREVNPGLEALSVSATTGAGIAEWTGWLRRRQGART